MGNCGFRNAADERGIEKERGNLNRVMMQMDGGKTASGKYKEANSNF